MKKVLILLLILSLPAMAQEKYMSFKPMNWDELQIFQLDYLLTIEELNLSKVCPNSLNNLKKSFDLTNIKFKHILGTGYSWSEYENDQGKKCIVRHVKVGSVIPDETVDPNMFQVLDSVQARVLLSAAKGIGFKEKGITKTYREINKHNQYILNKKYEKYGGREQLKKFIIENPPKYPLTEEEVKNPTNDNEASFKQLSLIEYFELLYTEEEKEQFYKNIKKKD